MTTARPSGELHCSWHTDEVEFHVELEPTIGVECYSELADASDDTYDKVENIVADKTDNDTCRRFATTKVSQNCN